MKINKDNIKEIESLASQLIDTSKKIYQYVDAHNFYASRQMLHSLNTTYFNLKSKLDLLIDINGFDSLYSLVDELNHQGILSTRLKNLIKRYNKPSAPPSKIFALDLYHREWIGKKSMMEYENLINFIRQ